MTLSNTIHSTSIIVCAVVYAHMYKAGDGLWYYFPLIVMSAFVGALAAKAERN